MKLTPQLYTKLVFERDKQKIKEQELLKKINNLDDRAKLLETAVENLKSH